MIGRILGDLTGMGPEEEALPRPAPIDRSRLGGVSSPPDDLHEDSDSGFGGMWKAIPFLPGLVEAIVGTPYEDDEDEDDDADLDDDERSFRQLARRQRAELASVERREGGSPTQREAPTEQKPLALRVLPVPADGAAALPSPDQAPSASGREAPLTEPSALLRPGEAAALARALPSRFRLASWRLLYSSLRDGISMQTMLRQASGRGPTVLLVRDMDRYVFGAYCSEAWKLDPRFYGTGETFVFRLQPGPALAWKWWVQQASRAPNDYFMFGDAEGIAVGGAGGYALWVSSDLAKGLSRPCLTFGSPPLSKSEEFDIGAVELWWLR